MTQEALEYISGVIAAIVCGIGLLIVGHLEDADLNAIEEFERNGGDAAIAAQVAAETARLYGTPRN